MKKSTSTASRGSPLNEAAEKQVHKYDKIIRENIEAALPGLMKNVLGIHAVRSEKLPDSIQHTKERNLMLLRRYRLPIYQFVIFIGKGIPRMADAIHTVHLQFKYQLVNLSAVDYRILLSADNPEEKMFAILANFGDCDPRQAVETIVKEIVATSSSDFAKQRYIEQLRILSNLRNLGLENVVIMDSITEIIWNNRENDVLYQLGAKEGMEKGMEKGLEKKTLEVVRTLLLNTNHTIPEIASLVNVSEYFVRKVKKSLQA